MQPSSLTRKFLILLTIVVCLFYLTFRLFYFNSNSTYALTVSILLYVAEAWGIFNLFEGIIDHQILGIHHVREESLAWDVGFLAFGVALIARSRLRPAASNSPSSWQ